MIIEFLDGTGNITEPGTGKRYVGFAAIGTQKEITALDLDNCCIGLPYNNLYRRDGTEVMIFLPTNTKARDMFRAIRITNGRADPINA
jgi:hypothetical protein